MLAPGIGEIIAGSQREERLAVLDGSMAECHIDQEHYAWYCDLRRYGNARKREVLTHTTLPVRTAAQQA